MRIRQLGDPLLRQVSAPVSRAEIKSEYIQNIIKAMKQTLDGIKSISDTNGNALSAPQAGHLVRLILLRIDGMFVPMINPEIIDVSDGLSINEEECFSFYAVRAKVQRHQSIRLAYTDELGNDQTLELEGEYSALAQHEIDHLNGVLFLDHVESMESVQSIDFLLQDDQVRLQQVKSMMEYMTEIV
ncbi:peptide deformylase [Agaribacter flavus]|uniref:Peptide deformylase n=1 Tax=Agaribacter flavus TaxID=1902781 RepID=A0ABV7FIK4_9ALTE